MAKKFDFLSPGINIREIDQSFIPAQREATGPIIIGRTKKGPANKPVRVRNLDDFVSVFGLPVPGGNGALGDVWREGNTVGPTYASYAAQAWLASEQSPVTIVRVSGEQHSAYTGTGNAGWHVGGASPGGIASAAGTNDTAYGLFLVDEAKAGELATPLLLEAGTKLNATTIGLLRTNATVLNFSRQALSAVVQNPTGSTFQGVKFQVDFDERNGTVPGGTVVRTLDGVDSVAKITCGTSGVTTATAFMNLIELAIEEALNKGDIADVSVDNEGASLRINNLKVGATAGDRLGLSSNMPRDLFFKVSGVDAIDGTTKEAAVDIVSGTIGVATAGATRAASVGSLAAVLYCSRGSIALSGTLADAGEADKALAGALIESVGNACEFKLVIKDESGIVKDEPAFNFSRNSANYIRSVLNTNPQLTNASTISSEDRKTYWLGETFNNHLEANVTTGGDAGTIYGLLMPLGIDDTSAKNWGNHKYGAREAKSGWVFSDRSTNEQKIFRFKSMHVGNEIQKNYLIAIEEITAPANPAVNPYGSFTVCFKDISGQTIEKFSGCNLNPASPNYVAAKIGDQYQEWSDTDKRYRTYGDFRNRSDLFYIEMNENISNGGGMGLNPAGFYGPVRPKGFSILAHATEIKNLDATDDFTGSIIRHAHLANLVDGHTSGSTSPADLGSIEHIKLQFPKLRMRDNGSDGGVADQARTYWGIRPKLNAQSTNHDPDYADYVRPLGMELGETGTHIPANTNFEYSFIFSLDDVSGSVGGDVWTWASGNYGSNTSFTAKSGKTFGDLLDEQVRQFIMPVWGGSEGFDISEMEPLRNDLIDSDANGILNVKGNYVDYSISKAIDSITDDEVVPANMLLAPGIWKSAVTNKLINVAERRKDVLALIDLEHDYIPRYEKNATKSARLGSVKTAVSTLRDRNLNSSYAAAFYPWVQVSDNLNGGNLVWLPPSIAALGAIGRSQAQSELWFAPAGFNRGGLGSLGGPRGPAVLQARQRLDSKERDLLYEKNINPIATFPAEGVVIFGQKTLQAGQSALDRINVRRLLLFLKAEVSAISRNLLFDQNVQSTWNRFKNQVEPLLADTQSRFGLTGYKLVLDETTTTADLIDRNIMYAKIFIKPARAIEYIVVDFVITRTGADFA